MYTLITCFAADEIEKLAIWSTVEPGMGITAASLATLRPLIRTVKSQVKSKPMFQQLKPKSWSLYGSSSGKNTTINSKSIATSSGKTDKSKNESQLQSYYSGTHETPGMNSLYDFDEIYDSLRRYDRFNTTPRLNIAREHDNWIGLEAQITPNVQFYDPYRTVDVCNVYPDEESNTPREISHHGVGDSSPEFGRRATWWRFSRSSVGTEELGR
jgi:hypothetical protein